MRIRLYIVGILLLCSSSVSSASWWGNDSIARAHYERARALREQGEQVEAMEHLITAQEHIRHNDTLLGRIYANIANMCRLEGDHALAAETYQMSAQAFQQSGDSTLWALALNNIAWEYAVSHYKDTSAFWMDSARAISNTPLLNRKLWETSAAACMFAQEYDSVLYYTTLLQQSGDTDSYHLMLRAQAYSYLDQNDSAVYYARCVLQRTDNLFYLDDVYYILTHNDSTQNSADLLHLSNLRTDVQTQIEERRSRLAQAVLLWQQYRQRTSPTPWLIALCGALLAVGIGWPIFRRLRRPSRQTRLLAACELLRHHADLRTELQWRDYAAMCAICDERLMGIVSKLQARQLNEREIRICLPVLIGLSYSQTAELLNRAESGIGKDKYTIAKKLGVNTKQLRQCLIQMACQEE